MTRIRGTFWIVAIASVLASVDVLTRHSIWAELASGVRADEITVLEATSPGTNRLWIDARLDAAFAAEHVTDALQLNEDRWEELIAQVLVRWRPGVTVVVYCDDSGCRASRNVAERLRKDYGIEPVRVLHGGWNAWKGREHR